MAAFSIVQVEPHDEKAMEEYVQASVPVIAQYGGEIVAVDLDPEVAEGSWHGPITIVVQWPDRAAARRWYESPEYQKAREIRLPAADTNVALVESSAEAS